MALYTVKYPAAVLVNALYARQREDLEFMLAKFNDPTYDFVKPGPSFKDFSNQPSDIELAQHSALLFDDGLSYVTTTKPFQWEITDDFTLQVRPESVEVFALSQPYFSEHRVGNLYAVAYQRLGPSQAVAFLPPDIVEKMAALDVSVQLERVREYNRERLRSLSGNKHYGFVHTVSPDNKPVSTQKITSEVPSGFGGGKN